MMKENNPKAVYSERNSLKLFQKISKLLLFSISAIISTLVAFVLIETFFFDKLLYKKSPLHGYDKNQFMAVKQKNNFFIEKRIRDLRAVINPVEKSGKVLGTQTEVYSIALIGDSLAYGTGVRGGEVFGRVLEAKLNKIRPTKVYILALPGDSIVENYAKFLLARSVIGVNLFVFSMVDNDLIYDHINKYPNEVAVYDFLKESCPREEFIYHWEDEDLESQLKNGLVPSHSDQFANRCWVETVVKKTMSFQNTRLFFFSNFSLNDLGLQSINLSSLSGKLRRELEINYVRLIEDNGGTVVYRLDIPVKKWGASKLEGHASREFHSLLAETLYQEITANPRWGF